MMKVSRVLTVCSFALAVSACETEAWHNFTQPLPPSAAEVRVAANLANLDHRLAELENPKTGPAHVIANDSDIDPLVIDPVALADGHGGGPITKVVKEKGKEGGEDSRPAEFLSAKVQPSDDKKAPGFIDASAPSHCAGGAGCNDRPVASGSFAIHLASYKHMQYLERGWTELRKQFPVLLAHQVPRAKRFTRDDGTVYIRLKAGPFETKQQVYDLCNKLKAKQVYCALSRFDGIDLDGFVDL